MTDESAESGTEPPEHLIEIVQRGQRARGDDMDFWRCTCGASAGGRWYRSATEAQKAADRHLSRLTG